MFENQAPELQQLPSPLHSGDMRGMSGVLQTNSKAQATAEAGSARERRAGDGDGVAQGGM